MKYIDFEGHHYGLYVKYEDAKLRIVLVENKQKVCNLTTMVGVSKISAFDKGAAYVDTTKIEFAERLLQAVNCKPTGNVLKDGLGHSLVEYDLSPLVRYNNKEMKRDLMKPGMIQISENAYISTSIVYYAYHDKKKSIYAIVTTESITYRIQQQYFIAAIRDYNIPVYKLPRRETL